MKKHLQFALTKERLTDVNEDIENRREYIGGSDIGTIMGVNPWKSPYTLWAEKTGLIEPEDVSDLDAVWFGVMEEDIIAQRFTMKTGLKVRKSNYAYGVMEFPFFRGHVDRLASKGKWGLEIKTTSSWNKTNYDEGEVPEAHYWQCMFYMLVTGYDMWYLATKRDNRFYITKIVRDDVAIVKMIDTCREFWEHVKSGEPVEIDGSASTQRTLDEMYPEEQQEKIVNLDKVEDTLIALLEIGSQEKNLKELSEKYKNEIKAAMKEAEKGESTQFIVSWKTDKRGGRRFTFKEKEV